YAAAIPANGGTLVFQSSVTPGGLNGDQPTNYILNGVLISGSGAAPTSLLSIADASLLEGDSGSNAVNFQVTLQPAATNIVSVAYGTSSGSAIAGEDFSPVAGTLIFNPGVTQQFITVFVYGDTNVEPDETFTVTLSNPTNATLLRAAATGTILTDDYIPV